MLRHVFCMLKNYQHIVFKYFHKNILCNIPTTVSIQQIRKYIVSTITQLLYELHAQQTQSYDRIVARRIRQ